MNQIIIIINRKLINTKSLISSNNNNMQNIIINIVISHRSRVYRINNRVMIQLEISNVDIIIKEVLNIAKVNKIYHYHNIKAILHQII